VANGCEAAPDALGDGSRLDRTADANLVPANDVDTFTLEVHDNFQLFCDGLLRITLIAPADTTQRLEVIDSHDRILASVTSSDGEEAVASVYESSCGGDDSATLIARVTTVRGHSAQYYSLDRSGGF
jgi:hypothetical protein